MTGKVFFPQPEPIRPVTPQKPAVPAGSTGRTGFDKILAERMSAVKFSSHAEQRLRSRNIELGAQELQKLQDAVGKARQKGARESLILMDSVALVVSIKNNTVITVVDGEHIKDNVFTNIDSTVVV